MLLPPVRLSILTFASFFFLFYFIYYYHYFFFGGGRLYIYCMSEILVGKRAQSFKKGKIFSLVPAFCYQLSCLECDLKSWTPVFNHLTPIKLRGNFHSQLTHTSVIGIMARFSIKARSATKELYLKSISHQLFFNRILQKSCAFGLAIITYDHGNN